MRAARVAEHPHPVLPANTHTPSSSSASLRRTSLIFELGLALGRGPARARARPRSSPRTDRSSSWARTRSSGARPPSAPSTNERANSRWITCSCSSRVRAIRWSSWWARSRSRVACSTLATSAAARPSVRSGSRSFSASSNRSPSWSAKITPSQRPPVATGMQAIASVSTTPRKRSGTCSAKSVNTMTSSSSSAFWATGVSFRLPTRCPEDLFLHPVPADGADGPVGLVVEQERGAAQPGEPADGRAQAVVELRGGDRSVVLAE